MSDNKIRVTTFNARTKCKEKKNSWLWEKRMPRFVRQIEILKPDLLGLQEVQKCQFDDILPCLSDYGHEFLSRDGVNDEGTPVFYKKDKFTLVRKGSYYLNEQPEEPGLGWDAKCLRVASYVTLIHNATGKKFTYFNTHLDHVGRLAQINGIKLMVEKMKNVGGSMILTGDFNVKEGSETYLVAREMLNDAKYLAKVTTDGITFHNYGQITEKSSPIDYVFVSDDIKVRKYSIYNKKTNGGYASDHYAVSADLIL